SKATATVRQVHVKNRNNEIKAFLDLIYVNGEFQENENIIGFDIVSGFEKIRAKVLPSITHLKVTDGGIGHELFDEFNYHDGIGVVTGLKDYSITNIKIKDPGHFYSVGDPVIFENDYTGATQFANAYVESIEPNYALSDYVNFLNNTLKYTPVQPYETSDLLDYFQSQTFANTDLLGSFEEPYNHIGSIKSIRIEKSGLDYRFAPNSKIINNNFQAQNLYLYELYIDDLDANTYFLIKDSIVILNDEPAVYAGSKIVSDDDVYFEGIDILAEDPYVETFYAPKILKDDLVGAKLQILRTTTAPDILDILTKNYNEDNLLTIEILNFNNFRPLGETASIESFIGPGVSTIQITDPGLMTKEDTEVCFIKGPLDREYDANNIIHPLDTTIEYETGVVFDSIGEFKENNSNLSSEKHIQDNYYYQDFSYVITSKIPTQLIEPLLLDELHPAGFIAFIRNRIEDEVSSHIKAEEFPRIEILAEGADVASTFEAKPYIVQMNEQYANMNRDISYSHDTFDGVENDITFDDEQFLRYDSDQYKSKDYLYTFVEVNDTAYLETQAQSEVELEDTELIDVFEGFRLFVEDVIIRPESMKLQEFQEVTDGPFFDDTEVFFDSFTGLGKPTFDSYGVGTPTGYGTTSEYMRLERKELFNYGTYTAVESFLKIISVEDRANWKTNLINSFGGKIGDRVKHQINNHKAIVEDIIHIATTRNVGGKIVVRDWLPLNLEATFRFDNEFIYMDANTEFNEFLNYSGEIYNYTPNPIWYFDNTDDSTEDPYLGNDNVDDFSNTNILKPLYIDLIGDYTFCITPHHVHNSFNFSNEPATSYIPMVSGNSLGEKGAYLPETEILTRDKGFIFIKDVTSDDYLAFVHDNGKITWRKPDGLLKRNYSGMMYHFSDFNRLSVTVTPDQDLVTYDDRLRPHITKAQKIRSKNINLPQSIHKSFGLVDLDLVGGVHNAVVDFIPIDERIHRTDTYYEGEVYCVIFNEYREYIPMDIDVSNVDIDLLQINSQIDNTTTYPKFQPAYFKFINHDMYENHIKIDIQKRDFTLNIETPDPIVFDFNTAKEPNTYVSFVREDQLINDAKIRNFHGPSFDDVRPYSFDSTDGDYTFDGTGERYVVHPAQIYFGSNHITTKIPDPVEQILNYTEEINYDYFTFVDGHLPRYSNGDVIGAEITKYEELKYETEEIKYQIHETLTTEQEYKLYDRQFGIDITFDIQNADSPECISGHFDYIGDGEQDIYKFSSNNVTAEIPDILTFDELTDPCNYDSIPEGRRALFNTFDTVERSFDQTQDIIYDFGQKVDTHLIKSNSEDRALVASKQNLAGISYKNNKTEVLIRGGDFHQPLVVTIKNYRPDPKKKFFDSLNYYFDKNYAWSFFTPWEHYGFDSEDTRGDSWIAPYDDVFRNVSVTLVIHQHTDAYGPFGKNGCFDSTARLAGFDKEGPSTFDNGDTKEVFFKYEDIDGIEQWRSKRIPLKCPPKPFVKSQPKLINAAFGDVSITSGNNEPIQTLQLINFTDESGIKGYGIEQVLINDNSIEICDLPYIYYDDVIRDFTFKVMYPYFLDLGCDPDTTPGTKATPDYTLSNINLEYLTSNVYHDVIQTFDDLYVDSTMLVGDIHNWIILENYILSCDPIRYDDVIYPYTSKLISPYINETCPSKQTLHSREVQSELHIINSNTVSYMVDDRDAIVPTEDKFQFEIEILANTANDVIWEHEIHSHIRSRNCAIGLNEFIHIHSFKEITDCHLKEPLSYWIEDSIYTAFAVPEFSIINDGVAHHPNYELGLIYPGATTVNYMAFEQIAFANTSNNGNLTTALLEHEIHTHIRGKNCAIGLNDFIYTHSFKEIDECYLKEPLTYWNGDAIYTAFAIPEFTITNDIVSQYPNTNYELGIIYPIVNEEQITTKPSNFDVRSSNTEHYITNLDQTFVVAANLLDKNIAFWEGEEISKKQYTLLDNSILQKALLPYIDDRIPTVFIKGADSVLQSQSNTEFQTSADSAFYFTPIENFVDSTIRVDDDDNDSHIVSQINVLDRYKTISKERTFAHRLKEPIDFDDQIMFFEIVDTDRDRIPSVTAKPFSNIINTANTDVLYTPTFSTYTYDTELFIDATTSTEGIEAPSITNHIHLPDRNTIIPLNRIFANRLNEYLYLDGIMMDFKLVDYDGNYIPSIKAFPFSIVNSDANTSSDLNASIEQIHSIPDLFIDGTITFDYFPEIERSKHLLADWNFIEVGEPIASYLKQGITNYTDRILRANRLDTTYGTKA
ncbi:hypothetical protein EB155_01720, partial [archaeon]|nr:hypothetical protein [archaeon]